MRVAALCLGFIFSMSAFAAGSSRPATEAIQKDKNEKKKKPQKKVRYKNDMVTPKVRDRELEKRRIAKDEMRREKQEKQGNNEPDPEIEKPRSKLNLFSRF